MLRPGEACGRRPCCFISVFPFCLYLSFFSCLSCGEDDEDRSCNTFFGGGDKDEDNATFCDTYLSYFEDNDVAGAQLTNIKLNFAKVDRLLEDNDTDWTGSLKKVCRLNDERDNRAKVLKNVGRPQK